MKVGQMLVVLSLTVLSVPISGVCAAEEVKQAEQPIAPHPSMTENKDGVLKQGEYEVISTNGSVTRSFCPYTCEMRGLPKQYCRTWKSVQEPDKCYVQDTRLPSEAVPIGR